ncbi:MAG TPA: VCBS repeat-containing protein [Pyrinomonadaceae bacterium]|nr:VCBS repeat-containing protein [Pyrinomonadaceae bacterium]
MKQLSAALVGQTTNATIEVCKKSVKSIFNFALLTITFLTFAVIGKAANFNVTNLADSGVGSLRQAISDANNTAGADTVIFDPTVFTSGRNFLTLQSELTISSDITIEGPPKMSIWVNGNSAVRILNITGGTAVTIRNLTFWRGNAGANEAGGCIRNLSVATISLTNTTFTTCTAGEGGAIYHAGGTLVMTNSTFTSNTASGLGGRGGAILVNGSNTAVNSVSSTFSGNTAQTLGGGLYFLLGSFSLRNSIIANNTAPTFPDVAANINSLGYNIIKNANGATITGTTTGNQLNVDPLVSSFSNLGGGTWAIPLQKTSPAVDAGDPSLANTLDQRRARRNTDGNYNGIAGVDIGAVERQKTSFDFDGEETAEPSVLRSSGTNSPLFWYYGSNAPSRPASFEDNLLSPNPNAFTEIQFGLEGDIAVPGDYDGDGKTDAAVFRPSQGTWYVNQTTNGFLGLNWGLAGDIPVPADYDGDGKTDFAVVRGNVWYIFKSTQGYTGAVVLGNANDKPVPADYDGDLKADTAVYSNGSWIINRSTSGQTVSVFGLPTDIPVPADFDGDGIDNIAVFRPSNGTWYVLKPNGGFDSIAFGLSTDKLVPADYDGDGKVDISVKRADSGRSVWYMLLSRDGYSFTNFGLDTDISAMSSLIRQ